MKKGFTITELLVAVALLAVVLGACAIIFNYSIDSQRTANATAEIMRNLRVITDQLNADFAGFAGMGIIKPDLNQVKADEIEFVATGDFQTANTYPNGTKDEPVRGNTARIYYGQAVGSGLNTAGRGKILARKVVIIAPGSSAAVNNCVNYGGINGSECDPNSLSNMLTETANDLVNKYHWLDRPMIDVNNSDTIRMYLVRGVDDFKIEYFNGFNADRSINWRHPMSPSENINTAFRFTFTLYDSKGIIKTGKRFEHIVYIGK